MISGSDFLVGLDLGQSQDPTALAVVERIEFIGEWDAVAWAYRTEPAVRLRAVRLMSDRPGGDPRQGETRHGQAGCGVPSPDVLPWCARASPSAAICAYLVIGDGPREM